MRMYADQHTEPCEGRKPAAAYVKLEQQTQVTRMRSFTDPNVCHVFTS